MTLLSNKIISYLITNLSELSDMDFDFLNHKYNLGYVNKYTCSTLKYSIEEKQCHIYIVAADGREFCIGYYFEIGDELTILVPFGFMSRQTINHIQSFNVSNRSDGTILNNLLLLEKISEYFYKCDIFEISKFKFNLQDEAIFQDFSIEYKHSFSIINNKIRFNYVFLLSIINSDCKRFGGNIQGASFKKTLLNKMNSKTQLLFNKDFNRLTKKELSLLKMYNI